MKKRIVSLIFFLPLLICVLSISACKPSSKKVIYNDLKHILFSEIKLSNNIVGADGSSFYRKFADAEFKVVHYIDSTSCDECALKSLHYWRSIIEDPVFSNVGFFFIVWSDYFESTRQALLNVNFKYPVYIDMYGHFGQENKYLKNKLYNTALINKDNQVVLVGDFLGNSRLMIQYRKAILGTDSL